MRLLAQKFCLRAQFCDYLIKKPCLDNAGEFTSQAFNYYCMSIGIDVEHLMSHVYTQNKLVELLIKHLKLIARPLLMRSILLIFTWGYEIFYATTFICIMSTSYYKSSPL